jgi:formylmethanofuran dehydrogenase subunit B
MAEDVDIRPLVIAFHEAMAPMETLAELKILKDNRTGARYCECHVLATKLLELANIDAALNPETQPGYRLNREIVGNQAAFLQMQHDALNGRSFSNIVAEYRSPDIPRPLEILGGQYRYKAIEMAMQKNKSTNCMGSRSILDWMLVSAKTLQR